MLLRKISYRRGRGEVWQTRWTIRVRHFSKQQADDIYRLCATDDASSLVRCSPDHDATNGFFVACFIRNIEPYNPDVNLAKKRKHRQDEGRLDGAKRKKRKKKPKQKD